MEMIGRTRAGRPGASRLPRLALLVGGATIGAASAGQLNPPVWPASVRVFGPGEEGQIGAAVTQAFATNGGHSPIDHGQFSSMRYAFLFKPGVYHVDVPVGFYTQVLGLGQAPRDVVFDSPRGVYCEEGDQTDMGGALSTFWRGAENFETRSSMLWAVSQAAPLRRVVVDGDLNLAQNVPGVGMGYSSGGFLGNIHVNGVTNSASQQQFCTRNADLGGGWPQGNWNMAFIGSRNAPPSNCGRSGNKFPAVSVPSTPVIAEKPFITIDGAGKYHLQVPAVQRGRVGTDFSVGLTVGFENVYVATDADTAAQINTHLARGLHVVLSPGIYKLEVPLVLNTDNQVLLGLGLATLVATKGTAAVKVGNVDGVRVAGVLLQAGTGSTDALLQWGDGTYEGNSDNPGFMSDLFARVGGPNDPAQYQVEANTMVRVASGHVVGDNLWLWRADHGVAGIVKSSMNPCNHGLVVTGSHVTMYGLASEHTLRDLVQWAGDAGETYFFQSELPYDVTQAFGDAGYVGYRVNDSVTTHKAYGLGVYHFFRDFPVVVQRGIAVPPWVENSLESPLSVFLTGKGKVLHVVNDKGETTEGGNPASQVKWYCEKGPNIPPAPVSTSKAPVEVVTQAPTPIATVTMATTSAKPTTAPKPGEKCIAPWQKCGGHGYTGATCCAHDYQCVEQGYWTSQCIPLPGHKWTDEDRGTRPQSPRPIPTGIPTAAPTAPAPPAQPGTTPQVAAPASTAATTTRASTAATTTRAAEQATSPHLGSMPPPWILVLLVVQSVLLCGLVARCLHLSRKAQQQRQRQDAAGTSQAIQQVQTQLNEPWIPQVHTPTQGNVSPSARNLSPSPGSQLWSVGEV